MGSGGVFPPDIEHGLDGVNQMFILPYTEHGLGGVSQMFILPYTEHGLGGVNQMFILPYIEHGLDGVNQMFILRYRARARWSFPPLHRAWARGSLGCRLFLLELELCLGGN